MTTYRATVSNTPNLQIVSNLQFCVNVTSQNQVVRKQLPIASCAYCTRQHCDFVCAVSRNTYVFDHWQNISITRTVQQQLLRFHVTALQWHLNICLHTIIIGFGAMLRHVTACRSTLPRLLCRRMSCCCSLCLCLMLLNSFGAFIVFFCFCSFTLFCWLFACLFFVVVSSMRKQSESCPWAVCSCSILSVSDSNRK